MLNTAKSWLVHLVLSGLAVLAPIKPLLLVVGFLVSSDFVSGMLAARKRKEPITSAAMRRTVTKLLIFQIAVLSGFAMEIGILEHAIPVAKLVAGAIALSELKSVLENVETIHGQRLFTSILKKLGSSNDDL